jgi:uncharacterized protein
LNNLTTPIQRSIASRPISPKISNLGTFWGNIGLLYISKIVIFDSILGRYRDLKVIAREKELELIEEIYTSQVPELTAVWGRRRIGKTYLIRNGRRHNDGAYLEITGQKDAKQHLQLSHFQDALSKAFFFGQRIEKIKNWTEAFRSLQSAITFAEKTTQSNKPITLFFDEVAWLDSRRSGFLNALEHFWNSWASNQANIKIFVCSSASSWIVSKILKGKGGWHRRATRRIHLMPFTLAETKEYLESKNIHLSVHDLISLYMILGGTAGYLDQIKRGASLPAIVNHLFLEENGSLKDEFEELYYSLFNSANEHIKIVRTLSRSRQGLTKKEIREISKIQSGSHFTGYLNNLEQSDFIEKYQPFGTTRNVAIKYRLKDFFSLFYLTWLESSKTKRIVNWQSVISGPTYKAWAGFSFEYLCWNNIDKIVDQLGLAKANYSVSKYTYVAKDPNDESAEIDLLIDVAGAGIYLLELKFHTSEFTLEKAGRENIEKKIRVLRNSTHYKRSVFTLLLCSGGVRKNAYLEEVIDKVLNVKDLLQKTS